MKLSQINGLMLGFNPVIFSSLVNFVNPRSSSAAVCPGHPKVGKKLGGLTHRENQVLEAASRALASFGD